MADPIRASSSLHLLNLVGQVLSESGVRWGAIGALAVAYHGWVRASMDADALITLRGSGIDTEELKRRLIDKGFHVDFREGDSEDPLGFVYRIQDDGGNQVDLIGGIRKLDPKFFDRIIRTELNGIGIRISSAEDLLALKLFAGGPLDLEDAAGMLNVLGSAVDRTLVADLCKKLGQDTEARSAKILGS